VRDNGESRRVGEQREQKNQHAVSSGLTRAYPSLPSVARDAPEVACTKYAVASLAKTVGGRDSLERVV
jgi:hypothetical protein